MQANEKVFREIDEPTLRRAQRGDDHARRDLIAIYQAPVFALLWRRLGPDRALVEALAEKTFVQALGSLERFAPLGPARPSTWLLSLATRRAQAARNAPTDDAAEEDASDSAPAQEPIMAMPPGDFAERVLAALHAAGAHAIGTAEPASHAVHAPRPGSSRTARTAAVIVAVACAGVIVVALARQSRSVPAVSDHMTPTERTTAMLGRRGVAVLEPGADLTWHVAPDGTAMLEQQAGQVFYRVDRGGAFTVRTPVAEISVMGTCFDVRIQDPSKQTPAGSALVVTVYEGRVHVENPRGRAQAGPGEMVTVHSPNAPPRPVPE